MKAPVKLRSVFVALVKVPLYALYGAFVLLLGYFRLMLRLGDGVRLLAATLDCPSCGEANSLDGRWKCRACSAIYHGACFHCSFCGAGASFFSCRRCGISIPLRRPS